MALVFLQIFGTFHRSAQSLEFFRGTSDQYVLDALFVSNYAFWKRKDERNDSEMFSVQFEKIVRRHIPKSRTGVLLFALLV